MKNFSSCISEDDSEIRFMDSPISSPPNQARRDAIDLVKILRGFSLFTLQSKSRMAAISFEQ